MPTSNTLVLGADTHKDVHVAVLLDQLGRRLAVASFPATDAGNQQLWQWATGFGGVSAAGVEGTGSYGHRLAQFLVGKGVQTREVNRPDRARRRRRGKSDPVDAENAARAVLAGEATAIPKDRRGVVGELRALLVTRRSAVKARTQAHNQLKGLLVEADDLLRDQLGTLRKAHFARACARSPAWSKSTRSSCWPAAASVPCPPPSCWSPPAPTRIDWSATPPSPRCAAPAPWRPPPARPPATGSTAAATAPPTVRCG